MHSENGQACFLDSMPGALVEQELAGGEAADSDGDEAIAPFR